MRKAQAWLSLAAALLLAPLGAAQALNTGHCGTQAEVSAELKAAGQALVAGMESRIFNPQSGQFELIARMLTADPARAAWFLVSGDRPFGVASGMFCVTLKGTDLKIFDHRAAAPQPVSRYGFTRAAAEAECKGVNETSPASPECGVFDDVLATLGEVYAERPVLQGQIISRRGDAAGILTIAADPDAERDYRRLFSTATGATAIHGFGQSFFLADDVIDALDGEE